MRFTWRWTAACAAAIAALLLASGDAGAQTKVKQAGFKVLSEEKKKVSGRDAVLWEYEGDLRGRAMKWISLAVADTDRVYLATGTSAAGDEALSQEFKASLETFKVGE